jgi:hypothetical protein
MRTRSLPDKYFSLYHSSVITVRRYAVDTDSAVEETTKRISLSLMKEKWDCADWKTVGRETNEAATNREGHSPLTGNIV